MTNTAQLSDKMLDTIASYGGSKKLIARLKRLERLDESLFTLGYRIPTADGCHTCNYHCRNPACVIAQRDELRDGGGRG